MTDKEVLAEMQSDSMLNEVRKALSSIVGKFEQENMQRRKPDVFTMRRMEFAAAQQLIDIVRHRIIG